MQNVQEPETVDDAKNELLDYIEDYGEYISYAHSSGAGPQGWFKEFIKSKVFNELSDDEKEKTFDCFVNVKYLFDKVDEILRVHKLSHYGVQ